MNQFHQSDIRHYIPEQVMRHLDIGSNVGALLESSYISRGSRELYGIEINKDAVEVAKSRYRSEENFHFFHGSADQLDFSQEYFNIATASEVLEHIPDEFRAATVKEISRVLTAQGVFAFTVPHKGLFYFLDPSNFRFYFPRLYTFVSRFLGGRDRDKGFDGEKHGVVWHHHFSVDELKILLKPQFEIKRIRYRGCLLAPVVEWIAFPLYRLNLTNSFLFKILKNIQKLEYKFNFGQFLGYNVLVIATPRK